MSHCKNRHAFTGDVKKGKELGFFFFASLYNKSEIELNAMKASALTKSNMRKFLSIFCDPDDGLMEDSMVFKVNPLPNSDARLRPSKPLFWDKQEVMAHADMLATRSTQHMMNIFIRPDDYRYILIDDVSKDQAKRYRPCLIVETSEANYQAWYRLGDGCSEAHAMRAQKYIVNKIGGDQGATGLKQLGRLPGHMNRKPGRKKRFAVVAHMQYATDRPGGVLANIPEEAYDHVDRYSPTRKRKRTAGGSSQQKGSRPDMTEHQKEVRDSDWAVARSMIEMNPGITVGELTTEIQRMHRDAQIDPFPTNPDYAYNTAMRAINYNT